MTRKNKVILVSCIGVILLMLGGGAVGVWYYYFKSNYGYEPLPFSEAAWAAADDEHRGYMLDDFLAKYDPRGMTRAEVIALLGEDDSGGDDKESMYYFVGERGSNPHAIMGGLSYVFVLHFNKNGKVDDYHMGDYD
jgi:hypothetical protein